MTSEPITPLAASAAVALAALGAAQELWPWVDSWTLVLAAAGAAVSIGADQSLPPWRARLNFMVQTVLSACAAAFIAHRWVGDDPFARRILAAVIATSFWLLRDSIRPTVTQITERFIGRVGGSIPKDPTP